MNYTNFSRYRWRVLALSMSLLIAGEACGYDFPPSERAIRDAYFLGTKGPSQGSIFLGQYTHAVNQLKVGACTSAISLETPFAHVALHASKAVNYSAQDAVKEFLGKPAVFLVHLEICYLAGGLQNPVPPHSFLRQARKGSCRTGAQAVQRPRRSEPTCTAQRR